MSLGDDQYVIGQWKDGMLNGFAKKAMKDLTYYGSWKQDRLHGFGAVYETKTKKRLFEGYFKNGLRDGFGREINDQNMIYAGYWK